MPKSKYDTYQINTARKLIINCKISRDSLPYSKDFEALYHKYKKHNSPKLSKHEFWLLLSNTGKKGGCRQKEKIKLKPLIATPEEAFEILRLCPENIGSRDRLPYTLEFEDMYRKFKNHTSRNITKNDFWRLLSRIAKRSRKPKVVDFNPDNLVSKKLVRDLFTMNPWWKGNSQKSLPKTKRHLYNILFDKITTKSGLDVLAVRGPRQVGKTTIQEQMIYDMLNRKRLIQPAQILRVQFDDISSIGEIEDPIITIVDWYEKNILKESFNDCAKKNKPVYLFLDEIQDVQKWSEQIKHIIDHKDCKIYITGSSALRILAGRESLAGRMEDFVLTPLSLHEIAKFEVLNRWRALGQRL